jgi:hypothetical protein
VAVIERYRPDDRRALDALYRRVFGHDAAESSRLRWDWQYRLNPLSRSGEPRIWVGREGTAVVGQIATIPVRLLVKGREIDGAWGTDAMVVPERQRQGLGELLVRTWDASSDAVLGLGLAEATHGMFEKLRWPLLEIPCLVKPLSRRALRIPRWPAPINRLVSALTLPVVRFVARTRPLAAETRLIRRFDESLTGVWERVSRKLDLSVRRDASYLNWRFIASPHVRYSVAALRRGEGTDGYIVYRHVHEPLGRVTLIVDLLVDPDDEAGLRTLLAWVDREARANDSDKIRTYLLHAAFRRGMRRFGYFQVGSPLEMFVKINAFDVGSDFYQHTDRWHVTLGDSDHDR